MAVQTQAPSGDPQGFITCVDIWCAVAVSSSGESRIFEEAAAPVSFVRER
jgi:hypothetical protein